VFGVLGSQLLTSVQVIYIFYLFSVGLLASCTPVCLLSVGASIANFDFD